MKSFIPILLIFMFARGYSQNCELLCNGGFDNYFVTSSATLVDTLSCWKTMASDGKMEVWGSNFNNVPSYNGIQFAELNATEAATMFQDFSAGTGVALSISFAHRGRAGTDTVEVLVGPAGGPYVSLGHFGDSDTAWNYYMINYTPLSAGLHRIMFKPIYATLNHPAIGNFLDAVSVLGVPNLTVTASSSVVCAGATVTLSATGAVNYTWTSGPQSAGYSLTPVSSAVYTVTGDNGNNCPTTNTILINVNPIPQVTATASPNTICKFGTPAILSASGAQSYQWPGAANSPTILSNTHATTIYTVIGTDENGCSDTATVLVTVEICEGLNEGSIGSAPDIYPNPASDVLYISGNTIGKVSFINAAGQAVRTLNIHSEKEARIDVGELPRGLYIVKTLRNGNTFYSKIILGD